MRIVTLFIWGACLSLLSAIACFGYLHYNSQPIHLTWAYKNTQPVSAQFTFRLDQILEEYKRGDIASIEALTKKISYLPWIKSVRLRKLATGKFHISITPYTPYALLNKRFFINKHGEIKDYVPTLGYTPSLRVTLPFDQLQAFFPAIRDLESRLNAEGLNLSTIKITPSGIWTITLTSGWVLYFGIEPDFDKLFEQWRKALPQILERGNPASFDFRYNNAISVTYQGQSTSEPDK